MRYGISFSSVRLEKCSHLDSHAFNILCSSRENESQRFLRARKDLEIVSVGWKIPEGILAEAISLQTKKFSFISKGLTPGYLQPFILVRHFTRCSSKEREKLCASPQHREEISRMRKKDLVLWDKWEFILLAQSEAFAASELKHFSCFNFRRRSRASHTSLCSALLVYYIFDAHN